MLLPTVENLSHASEKPDLLAPDTCPQRIEDGHGDGPILVCGRKPRDPLWCEALQPLW
jgi:hypothetical protein